MGAPLIVFIITVLWLLKASLLLLYWRLTRKLERDRLLVVFTAVICALTYIGVILTISLACIPFWKYWRIRPLPSNECIRPPEIFIALAIANIL
jgi:hypothetical protein